MERVHVVSFNSESLPVELDGVSYLVDARQYGRTTVPALREQRDTSGEAGENALDTVSYTHLTLPTNREV